MDDQLNIASLKQETVFDLLIIGGGATGCGIAVDAASRGLKVALVDKNDLAEGTSCRSTKLVHGGVRYLEAAVKKLDKDQYHLVKEALHERGIFLKNAPHLAYRRALVTPIYKWWEVPYVYAGLVMYDILAGKLGLGHSKLISSTEALKRFPMLKKEGLKAGVIYYDGQFNDARMAVSLALTAQKHGAVIANHTQVTALEKEDNKICGARVQDKITGEEFSIRAHGVINATGPFVDHIRHMDDPQASTILEASSGIHIILPKRFVPPDTGMLIPKTEDGRVLFILPWQGHALIGTTDAPADIVDHPQAQEDEIEYILHHINKYFDVGVTRSDVMSVWCGLRPLVHFKDTANTAQLVREHTILTSDSGLLTIAGGKWTSYRRMAEETVDKAVHFFELRPEHKCKTHDFPVVGAENFQHGANKTLEQDYALDADIAEHLHHAYGDQVSKVAELSKSGLNKRLHPAHPFIEAEVVYVAQNEFAKRAADVLVRRVPLGLLDITAAKEALPRVVELMANHYKWDEVRCHQEQQLCQERLETSL